LIFLSYSAFRQAGEEILTQQPIQMEAARLIERRGNPDDRLPSKAI
jgi:hypothetical protein